MSWIIAVWFITIIIYFLSLRLMIVKSIDLYVDNVRDAILIIIIGLIPIANLIFLISTIFQYIENVKQISGVKLLRKLLFIKDEVDNRWR